MHTSLKSALFASGVLASVSLYAGVVDSVNETSMPAYNVAGLSGNIFTPVVFTSSSIVYTYVPSFDYTLTGIRTRFSTAGTPLTQGYRQISLDIFADAPSSVDGTGALVSFNFDLVPGSFDIVPGAGSLLTGTGWLGGSFSDLSLLADETYFIRLRGLRDDSNWAVGVNTVHRPALTTPSAFDAAYDTVRLDTSWPGTAAPIYSYTDPIFQFEGAPMPPAVPEPSTYGLIGAVGLMGFAALRRRFSRKA